MESNQKLIDIYLNNFQHSKQSQNQRKSSLKYFFDKSYYIEKEINGEKIKELKKRFGYSGQIFEITTSKLKEYFVWLKNHDAINITTKKNKWNILISFLNYTMEDHEEFLIKIPKSSVNWRGCNGNGKEVKEIATKEEIEQILQHFKLYNFKHYLIFRLFTENGMRKGELINSKYNDLNIEKRYIKTTGKTEDVVYYFSMDLAKYLNQYLNERKKLKINTDILFLTKFRGKYGNRIFNLLLKNVCRKLGIETNITCHTFRRSINTYRKKMGCNLEDRKILLNHKVNDVNTESYLVMNREEYLTLFDNNNPYENLNL